MKMGPGIKWGGTVILTLAFGLGLSSAIASADECGDQVPYLDQQTYNSIKEMFTADFKKASDMWNYKYTSDRPSKKFDPDRTRIGLFHNNANSVFDDIIEKYGLAKFEHFVALELHLVAGENSDVWEVVKIDEYGGTHFENFSMGGFFFGRANLSISFHFPKAEKPSVFVGAWTPPPLIEF